MAELCAPFRGEILARARATRDIFNVKPFRRPGPKTAYERRPGRDPVSIALAEAGALHADTRELWMLSGDEQPEYPLLNSYFAFFELPERQVPKRKDVIC